MWIAVNEDETIRAFTDCPRRFMRVPLNAQESLKKEECYCQLEHRFFYDKKYNYPGYWDISTMVLDGRGILSKEEVVSKIGFLPTWKMKPFEVKNYDILSFDTAMYNIVHNRIPSIIPLSFVSEKFYSSEKNHLIDVHMFEKLLRLDNKTVFISLPISGMIEESMKTASKTKEILKKYYPTCTFINPFDLNDTQDDVATCMGTCIKNLINCDAIVSLKGWEKSKGCNVERFTAKVYGLEIFDIDDLLFYNKTKDNE